MTTVAGGPASGAPPDGPALPVSVSLSMPAEPGIKR